MKTLKFEDLKLPQSMFDCGPYGDDIARAVWEQMRAHYEQEEPAHAWRLPDPPPGQQWHRDDWTQDMLPEGYRPLLLGEDMREGDERLYQGQWEIKSPGCGWIFENAEDYHIPGRTRRPLPAPVEWVPLGPEDIQPGSVVRTIGASWWKQVTGVRAENITIAGAGNLNWLELANRWEILRPGSTTWEPCKKPKP